MTASSGTNGTSTPAVVTTSELETRVARYRTALVALLELTRRDAGYRSWGDQMLINEIQRLLDEDTARPVSAVY